MNTFSIFNFKNIEITKKTPRNYFSNLTLLGVKNGVEHRPRNIYIDPFVDKAALYHSIVVLNNEEIEESEKDMF